MPNQDCGKHTIKATVWLDPDQLSSKRRSDLIAALLRSIAEYTDGWCAVENADDADITKASGMKFWFISEKKKKDFLRRVPLYLSDVIDNALTTD